MSKKKTKSEIWDETPFKLGVYKHKKSGKEAVARKAANERYEWEIDKGKTVPHPIFRAQMGLVEEGTGNYFFNKSLKNYEWVKDE